MQQVALNSVACGSLNTLKQNKIIKIKNRLECSDHIPCLELYFNADVWISGCKSSRFRIRNTQQNQ